MHLSMFDEESSGNILLDPLLRHEVVVYAVLLAGARVSCCMGDRETKLSWELGHEPLDHYGLAYATRSSDHTSPAPHLRRPPDERDWQLLLNEISKLTVGIVHLLIEPRHREVPCLRLGFIHGHFLRSTRQALLHTLFRFGTPPSQTLLQHCHVRRCKEDKGSLCTQR